MRVLVIGYGALVVRPSTALRVLSVHAAASIAVLGCSGQLDQRTEEPAIEGGNADVIAADADVTAADAEASVAEAAALDGADGSFLDAASGDATHDAGGETTPWADAGPLAVTVSNLRNGQTTSSGFVVGTASGNGLSAVYVSLDGGNTWAIAAGTTSWSMGLPTGSSTWRLGSAQTLWVYASDGANRSATTKLTVHAGVNKDVNGDGYADLAVGGYWKAAIFHSQGPSGIANAASPNTTLTGSDAGFGGDVLLADMNGDGYADVVAAAPGNAVYVFHSTGPAGVASASSSTAAVTFTGPSGSSFARNIVAGDVNGDGYPDVIIADPDTGSSAGALYVFQSVGGSEVAGGASTSATATFTGVANAGLGHALALGDANGDGRLDLLAGAAMLGGLNGAAYLYVADASGLADLSAPAATLSGAGGYGFGWAVALGDINGDGYADAVVGAPLVGGGVGSPGQGTAYVFQSAGTSGIASASDATATANVTGPVESGLGVALAVGDVNGDGYADVAAGAGNAVYVFAGGTSGLATTACGADAGLCSGAATTLAGPSTGMFTNFGTAVATTDLDGDGYADVAVGANATNSSAGAAYVFMSAGSSGVPSASFSGAQATLPGSPSSYFGYSVD